jgi:hypothetical protein
LIKHSPAAKLTTTGGSGGLFASEGDALEAFEDADALLML